jgi:hypothetical protein
MAKYCTRHGFPIPDDTKICNGCGNKCDFTHSTSWNTKTLAAVVLGVIIFGIIILAVFNL